MSYHFREHKGQEFKYGNKLLFSVVIIYNIVKHSCAIISLIYQGISMIEILLSWFVWTVPKFITIAFQIFMREWAKDPRESVGVANVGVGNVGVANIGVGNVDVANIGVGNLGVENIGVGNVGVAHIGVGNGVANIGVGNEPVLSPLTQTYKLCQRTPPIHSRLWANFTYLLTYLRNCPDFGLRKQSVLICKIW